MGKLDELMALPYTIELVEDRECNAWVATVKELPGCVTFAETKAEALELIEDAKEGWLACALEHGDPIPLPETALPSGKTSVRLPRSLHLRMIKQAEIEGVSLNALFQYAATFYLSNSSRALNLTNAPAVSVVVIEPSKVVRNSWSSAIGASTTLPLSGMSVAATEN